MEATLIKFKYYMRQLFKWEIKSFLWFIEDKENNLMRETGLLLNVVRHKS